jgi:four helix bundle protein
MGAISTFRDLDAWKIAMDVVELTYRLTLHFPDTERYGLVSQMRRASVSMPSNVAEGQAVGVTRWGLRYIVTAIASSRELETQLEIALRLGFTGYDDSQNLRSSLDRLQKLLYGLRRQHRLRIGTSISGCVLIAGLLFRFLS